MNDAYTRLPDDLPAPRDDGAADGLVGKSLPDLALPSTLGGELRLGEASAGMAGVEQPRLDSAGGGEPRLPDVLVVYVYPMTGTPGEALPEGWDDIPGARGCTPQSCAYRDAVAEFRELGASLVGISAQTAAEQAEFAGREHIPYPLLSDDGLRLAAALRLPTFEVEGRTFYRRLTLVAEGGRIVKVFYPVFPPDRDAAMVLAWLRGRSPGPLAPPPRPLTDGIITLRPWTETDLPAIDAATRDPEIVRRNRLPQPFDAAAWFARSNAQQARGEGVRLLVVDAATDGLLGAVSLTAYDAERRATELGYWMVAVARGKGAATRALSMLCDWALERLDLDSIIAETDADNSPSRGLLGKLGFRLAVDQGAEVRYELTAGGRRACS